MFNDSAPTCFHSEGKRRSARLTRAPSTSIWRLVKTNPMRKKMRGIIFCACMKVIELRTTPLEKYSMSFRAERRERERETSE